ncbi:hypothetical protein [Cellulomonas massiliensis]|uniref:hypothetical protein n=1 Tax=Cellulomonas massiliensis TaxID=1465811 RepID=UPI000378A378|nr:hypothetical protein [Cellulomonas massiliensis]
MSATDEPQDGADPSTPQGPGVELGAGEPTTFEPEEDPDAVDDDAVGTEGEQQG